MINILFVIDKYIDKKNKTQPSDLTGEMLTCRTIGLFNPSILYTEEFNNINIELPNYLNYHQIDVVFFSYFAGNPSLNPTRETLKSIKLCHPTIKFIFGWWDVLFHQYIRNCIVEVDRFASKHICFDGANLQELQLSDNGIFFQSPQPDNLFFPDRKLINVSFTGRVNTYNDRCMYLKYLLGNGINVNIKGGRVEDCLSNEDYAKEIRQSTIIINFPLSQNGLVYQSKERVYQGLACKSLALEMENPLTRQFLEPNKDYVEFTTPHDLFNKIQYYLNNEQERELIVEQGYKTYHQKFHHSIMWNYIKELVLS